MYLTKKSVSRRTVLRGVGATVAIPLLDAMTPAGVARASTQAAPTRLVCIEMVHGAAGSSEYGASKNLWSPADVGSDFDLTPSALSPLEPFRNYLTIVSDTDVVQAEAFIPKEIGGDHFRSSAVFLTQAHPRQTEGSDIHVGVSMDQLYAQRFGQDTPIPSMQLCVENVDQAGGCAYGYACVYTDTISWAAADQPLPMIRDPRVAFDQLFGAGGTPEQRSAYRRTNSSILDYITGRVAELKRQLGPADVVRLDRYLENIRELERRIERTEQRNVGGDVRALPEAPAVATYRATVSSADLQAAYAYCERLAKEIPRHQFKIPIQGTIGGDIIARTTIAPYRKDVTEKLYGGDVTRKKKLLEKQKKGKAKMKQFGSVNIPQKAFVSVLRADED